MDNIYELTSTDAATVAHIAGNHLAYRRQVEQSLDADGQPVSYAHWAGTFEVNVAELLEIIERLTRPAHAPVMPVTTTAAEYDAAMAAAARHDWDAEATEREQYAGVLAADEADQRRQETRHAAEFKSLDRPEWSGEL